MPLAQSSTTPQAGEFVGTRSSGLASSLPIEDPDHEGHPGDTAADIAVSIQSYLVANPADAVLLHIGTNNINSDDPSATVLDVQQILGEIDQWETDNSTPVTIFLALIIDRSRTVHSPTAESTSTTRPCKTW